MGLTVSQFLARMARLINKTLTADSLPAKQYREQCGSIVWSRLLDRMPAADVRAIADYRRLGLSADAGRAILSGIADKLLVPTRHATPSLHGRDELANVESRRLNRRRNLDRRHAHIVRAMIPTAWCQTVAIRWTDAPTEIGATYHREVEWPVEQRRRGPTWPSRKYDVLTITLLRHTVPAISADRREIRVGPWTYRRRRGHSLSVIYHPQGAEADRALFAAERNAERRSAIITACGEDLTNLFDDQELQRDDFGRLCRLYTEIPNPPHSQPRRETLGVFVRVVCPSTGRVYWLQVPPACRTAREAVAATFGLTPTEYDPARQT
jgi:hypothetical protein